MDCVFNDLLLEVEWGIMRFNRLLKYLFLIIVMGLTLLLVNHFWNKRVEKEPEAAVENIVEEEAAEDGIRESSMDLAENIMDSEVDEKPSESESKYYIVEDPQIDDEETRYGEIKQEHEEFQDQSGWNFFYYDIECFYFNETYPVTLNETLQTYYDSKREAYGQDSKTYEGEAYQDASNVPFDNLIFFGITYAGDDYVSLLFNDVAYMGGAHPYSALDGVTIDCSTGEIVTVDRFIDDSEEEIAEQIKAALDKDIVYDPKEWDYYITEEAVVFFYYDPRFWEAVAIERLGQEITERFASIEDIAENDNGIISSYDPSWTEEEIISAVNERSQYYRASAYYSEIVDYWENVREVRDISNVMEPLFETDQKYYTKEELESEPMLVIHLAKNEIYARHGYIFEDQDLQNYFMGCIWYRPTCDSADFDDSIFNEYERANLEILAYLDTYFGETR